MKTHALTRVLAVLMTLSTCVLPACSTVATLKYDRTTASADSTLPTSAQVSLTAPNYYTPPDAPNSAYTPENQLALLANRDFGGEYFLVVQEEGLENAIFPTSDELISVYADRRNRLVQEKYNVQLVSRTLSADEIIDELTAGSKNGSYFCDLLVVSPRLLKALHEDDLLVSLDSLPFFETDSICISANATAELNADFDGIYGVWGDVLRQPTRQLCVYYNKTLGESLGAHNLYAAVQSGQWDLDALFAAAERTTERVGASGILYDGDITDLLLALSGLTSSSDEGKALLESEAFLGMVDRLTALGQPTPPPPPEEEGEDDSESDPEGGESVEINEEEFSDTSTASAEEGEDGENSDQSGETDAEAPTDAYSRFIAGESLFYIGTQGEFSSFAMLDNVCGILPLPKYDSSAENYPVLTDQSNLPVLACPMNVASAAGTGIMLSALNAASCDEVNELFIQSVEQYVRDNGSLIMLNYLGGVPYFDRKMIFGS